jgi:hypothetical protein
MLESDYDDIEEAGAQAKATLEMDCEDCQDVFLHAAPPGPGSLNESFMWPVYQATILNKESKPTNQSANKQTSKQPNTQNKQTNKHTNKPNKQTTKETHKSKTKQHRKLETTTTNKWTTGLVQRSCRSPANLNQK